jgi:hypothetical protein
MTRRRRRVPSFTKTRPSRSSITLVTAPSGSVETAAAVVIRRIGGPLVFDVSAGRGGAGVCADPRMAADNATSEINAFERREYVIE